MEIAFLTSNDAKMEFAQSHLSKYNILLRKIPFNFKEIQSLDVTLVARDKAEQAIPIIKESFIIQDTGFYVNALNDFPGALFKDVFHTIGDERFLRLMHGESDRTAYSKGVVVYYNKDDDTITEFVGIVEGRITEELRGNNMNGVLAGRIWIPNNYEKTLAQMSDLELDAYMHYIESINGSDFENFGRSIHEKTLAKKL